MLKAIFMVLFMASQCMAWSLFGGSKLDTLRANVKVAAPMGEFDYLSLGSVGFVKFDSVVVPCTLFTASSPVDVSSATVFYAGQLKAIVFPYTSGTLVGGEYHTIRIPAAYMPNVEGTTYVVQILNSSSVELGILKLYKSSGPSGFNILTSSSGSLSSGTGGIYYGTTIVYY